MRSNPSASKRRNDTAGLSSANNVNETGQCERLRGRAFARNGGEIG
jgi:hypothetical protein